MIVSATSLSNQSGNPQAAPSVTHSAYAHSDRKENQATTFQPVSEASNIAKQQLNLREGLINSPLNNAVSAAGYSSDVASTLLTYGPDGKLNNEAGSNSKESLGGNSSEDVAKASSSVNATADSSLAETEFGEKVDGDEKAAIQKQEKAIELQEQAEIKELAARDREVRAHEQAHAAVGGSFAGAPSYDFQRGPDGVNYAVGGEVMIDTSRAATPEATIEKARTVRRAALAPAEPSPQDRKVAQEAVQIEAEARKELALERAGDREQLTEAAAEDVSEEDSAGSLASARDFNVQANVQANISGQREGSGLSESARTASQAFNNTISSTYSAESRSNNILLSV